MQKNIIYYVIIGAFVLFILFSYIFDFEIGKTIIIDFKDFSLNMLKIIPCIFILIGLFEVWVKKEKIEKHLGETSGINGILLMILLAGTTVGGLFIAFPVASTLYKKGTSLKNIFIYIGAAGLCRIPMMFFEASFLGIKFTIIRLVVSIPLVIIVATLLDKYLKNKNYYIK